MKENQMTIVFGESRRIYEVRYCFVLPIIRSHHLVAYPTAEANVAKQHYKRSMHSVRVPSGFSRLYFFNTFCHLELYFSHRLESWAVGITSTQPKKFTKCPSVE